MTETPLYTENQNAIPDILERMTDAVIGLDEHDVCLYMNDAAAAMLRKHGKKSIGKNIDSEFSRLDFPAFFKALGDARETQQVQILEENYSLLNERIEISIYPSSSGTTLIFKKQGSPPFFDSDNKYELLFTESPVPKWIVDTETLRYIDVNKAATKHYGYTREEFLAMPTTQIRPKEEVENYLKHFKNGNERTADSGIWKHQKKDGSILYADIHYHTVNWKGKLVRMVFALDVTEEILAKQKLKNSEQRFQALVESSDNAIFIVDEHGKNIEVNGRGLDLLGYLRSELLELNLLQLIVGEQDEKDAWFELFSNGTNYFSAKNLLCKDQRVIPAEIMSTKLPDGRILVTIKDISERLRKEEEVREANERFNYVLKSSNDGVWELDLKTQKAWWSENLYAILNYTPNSFEVTSEFFETLIHPEDKARIIKNWNEVIQSDSLFWSNEYRIRKADGSYGIFYERACILRDTSGVAYRMIGTMLDLTGLKKYELALAESENRLRTIVQTEPECIKVTDRSGIVLEMNPAGMEMLEATAEQILGKSILDVVDNNYRDQYIKLSERIFEGQPFKYEFEVTTFRGNKRWFESHVVPMRNPSGEITSSLAITRDITTQKKTEDEILHMNDRLRLLSAHLLKVREDERTLIAREIHDELGQQLTSLKIDLSWLRSKMPKDKPLLEEKAKSMISLIDDTVKSVRRISTELRPGILDDLGLIAALEWQSQEFFKRTSIFTDFTTNLPDERFDKSLSTGIFRVFQESLTNIARHSKATRVKSSLLKVDKNIVLTIADNGRGIEKSTLESQKTLGLMGMQERAMMMGGNLEIESVRGARIILTVPAPEPKSSEFFQ